MAISTCGFWRTGPGSRRELGNQAFKHQAISTNYDNMVVCVRTWQPSSNYTVTSLIPEATQGETHQNAFSRLYAAHFDPAKTHSRTPNPPRSLSCQNRRSHPHGPHAQPKISVSHASNNKTGSFAGICRPTSLGTNGEMRVYRAHTARAVRREHREAV